MDDFGQRRAGERGVEQQYVGTDPIGGHQRLDETAMVAADDPDDGWCAGGQ
jgi:hypothetical protein